MFFLQALAKAGANFFPEPDGEKYVSITPKVSLQTHWQISELHYAAFYISFTVREDKLSHGIQTNTS